MWLSEFWIGSVVGKVLSVCFIVDLDKLEVAATYDKPEGVCDAVCDCPYIAPDEVSEGKDTNNNEERDSSETKSYTEGHNEFVTFLSSFSKNHSYKYSHTAIPVNRVINRSAHFTNS